MKLKHVSSVSFFSGMLGGGGVVAVVAGVMAVSGGLDFSTRTVDRIVQAPFVAANTSRQTRGLTEHQIYEEDARGVVFVSSTGVSEAQSPSEFLRGEGGQQGTATGSGFEVDGNGTIFTNWHVVENAVKVTVSLGEDRKSVDAKVVGKDPSNDLAVLRIPTEGVTLHPLPLGDSSTVEVGEPVTAIGNPFGYTRTLTTGVISALQRHIQAPDGFTINNVLQTDAPINPGNSGGPLINGQGQVIGINSQIVTSGGGSGNVGIAFAVPINTTKSALSALERGGSVRSGH